MSKFCSTLVAFISACCILFPMLLIPLGWFAFLLQSYRLGLILVLIVSGCRPPPAASLAIQPPAAVKPPDAKSQRSHFTGPQFYTAAILLFFCYFIISLDLCFLRVCVVAFCCCCCFSLYFLSFFVLYSYGLILVLLCRIQLSVMLW